MLLLLLNYVVLRALWKIDVNLISALVNKSLYYTQYTLPNHVSLLFPIHIRLYNGVYFTNKFSTSTGLWIVQATIITCVCTTQCSLVSFPDSLECLAFFHRISSMFNTHLCLLNILLYNKNSIRLNGNSSKWSVSI